MNSFSDSSSSAKPAATLGNILVVDDNQDVLLSLRLLLKPYFKHVRCEPSPERIPAALNGESGANGASKARYDAILLDMNFTKDVMSGQEGFAWLEYILSLDPSAVVILMTAYGDVEMAIRAVKQGAMDFVLKPWQNEKLLATVVSAVKFSAERRAAETATSRTGAGASEQGLSALLGKRLGERVAG
jgi:two-component system, NtrC family, response regulator HydG